MIKMDLTGFLMIRHIHQHAHCVIPHMQNENVCVKVPGPLVGSCILSPTCAKLRPSTTRGLKLDTKPLRKTVTYIKLRQQTFCYS